MFNYLGTITRVDAATGFYYVKVPQISANDIPARAITIPGIDTRYNVDDVVVMGELESTTVNYIILGKLMTTMPATVTVSATDMTMKTGKIGKDVLCEKEYAGVLSTVQAGKLFAQADLVSGILNRMSSLEQEEDTNGNA